MTLAEAIAALAPFVGAGGLSGIVIAFFGWRQSVHGRKAPTLGSDGAQRIGAILVTDDLGRQIRDAIDRQTVALTQGHLAGERHAAAAHLGRLVDELDALRRVLGKRAQA
jgi:hypothetical protein